MDEYKKKIILLWILLSMILFVIFVNYDSSKTNTKFSAACFNCEQYDYTEFAKAYAPNIFSLNKKNINNVVITYNRFMSKKGKVTVSFNVLDPNTKKEVRKYGVDKTVDANNVKWSLLNDVEVNFVNGRVLLKTDESFQESDMAALWKSINNAIKKSL